MIGTDAWTEMLRSTVVVGCSFLSEDEAIIAGTRYLLCLRGQPEQHWYMGYQYSLLQTAYDLRGKFALMVYGCYEHLHERWETVTNESKLMVMR